VIVRTIKSFESGQALIEACFGLIAIALIVLGIGFLGKLEYSVIQNAVIVNNALYRLVKDDPLVLASENLLIAKSPHTESTVKEFKSCTNLCLTPLDFISVCRQIFHKDIVRRVSACGYTYSSESHVSSSMEMHRLIENDFYLWTSVGKMPFESLSLIVQSLAATDSPWQRASATLAWLQGWDEIF